MALILAIESATSVCSTSLFENGDLLDSNEVNQPNAHSSLLSVMVDELLSRNNLRSNQLQAIAISEGPGSYTGLRIGASLAKGICFASDLKLITVNTLDSIAYNAKGLYKGTDEDFYIIPMIDARRMEVYTKVLDSDFNNWKEIKAMVIEEDSFATFLLEQKCIFCGDGAEKCKDIITSPNAVFVDALATSRTMGIIAEAKFQKREFANVAYFEPFYLKEFQATVPKKNIFG